MCYKTNITNSVDTLSTATSNRFSLNETTASTLTATVVSNKSEQDDALDTLEDQFDDSLDEVILSIVQLEGVVDVLSGVVANNDTAQTSALNQVKSDFNDNLEDVELSIVELEQVVDSLNISHIEKMQSTLNSKADVTTMTNSLNTKLSTASAVSDYTPLSYFNGDVIDLKNTRIINQSTGGNQFLGNSAITDTEYASLLGSNTNSLSHFQLSSGDNVSQSLTFTAGGSFQNAKKKYTKLGFV